MSTRACVHVCAQTVFTTWLSAGLEGQTLAAQTEAEDDRAHWHVGQVCTKKGSKGSDRSDTDSLQWGHLWLLVEVELFVFP